MSVMQTHIDSPQQLRDFIDHRMDEAVRDARRTAERVARTEAKLAEFELLYSAVVDGGESRKNLELLRRDRETRWKKALKKAGGNEDEALLIYDEF
ncbi:MAG: hypothetical protein V1921_04880 [Candidatus Altiarchaeota archaeon]